MGLRFRRSFRILPGIKINLSRSGLSTSIGVRGAHLTVGPRGVRKTVGLPGSGLFYTTLERPSHPVQQKPAQQPIDPVAEAGAAEPAPSALRRHGHKLLWLLLILVILVVVFNQGH